MHAKWSDFRKLCRPAWMTAFHSRARAHIHILLFQPRKQRSTSSSCFPPDPSVFSDFLLFQPVEFSSEQNQPVHTSFVIAAFLPLATPSPAPFRAVPYTAGSCSNQRPLVSHRPHQATRQAGVFSLLPLLYLYSSSHRLLPHKNSPPRLYQFTTITANQNTGFLSIHQARCRGPS